LALLKAIEHAPTRDRTLAERAFLRELEGGCQVPIGVNSVIDGENLTLTGIVASVDGQQVVKDTVTGLVAEPESVGIELAQRLRQQGAKEILETIFEAVQRG